MNDRKAKGTLVSTLFTGNCPGNAVRGKGRRLPVPWLLATGWVLLAFAVPVPAAPADAASLVLVSTTAPDSVPEALKPFFGGRYRRADGRLIDQIRVPGRPPRPGRAPVAPATFSRSSVTITGVPSFIWTYGCSPTVAGMLCGLLDRGNYANLYTGSVNGGVCPLTNAPWGGAGTGEGAEGECSFVASHQGVDGRSTRGHVEDYWDEYGSLQDPYYGNWTPHNLPGQGDCLADFMGTSQFYPGDLQVEDGFTVLYYDGQIPYAHGAFGDGTYGVKLFMESRGYRVESYFNQYTAVPGEGRDDGFTFAQYKAEIDAGRPVFLHVVGHSMLGIGYDDATEKVYLHDTWNYGVNEMTWGGSYDNMDLYAVSVIRMKPGDAPPGDLYSGGSGTASAPYLIASKEDLLALRDSPSDYHRHFRVTADIDLAGETFSDALLAPDTDSSNDVFDGVKFSGTLDGGGYVIRNLVIDTVGADGDYLGLFGFLEGGGREVVTNLGLAGGSVTGGDGSRYLGALCGYNWSGTIDGCHATVAVSGGAGSQGVGGLCGTNWMGTLVGCYATGTVSGGANSKYVGGLCGENTSDLYGYPGAVIQNCYATGAVSAGDGSASVGGLCGDNYESGISGSYAEGRVTAGIDDSRETGGLCGSDTRGEIDGCHATGNVIGDWMVGGLCGSSQAASNCYATGTVDGYQTVGGLCGLNDGTIRNCYATGAVSGVGYGYFGGLCGDKNGGEVTDCHASGTVTGGAFSSHIGGLCGRSRAPATIGTSYATGAVSGGAFSYYLGGFCGLNGSATVTPFVSTIHDCYARGDVTGGVNSEEIGGFCGRNETLDTLRNCYSTGEVNGSALLGGFCGSNAGVVAACFWDTTTSDMGTSAGGSGAVGKTTGLLQVGSTFVGAGWDFSMETGAWKMPQGAPDYPVLAWEPELHMLDLARGWTLVSLPIEPVDPAVEAILGGGRSRAGEGRAESLVYASNWAGGGGYALVTEMHACVGYWVYVAVAEQIWVVGTRVSQESLPLIDGWSLHGVNAEYAVPTDARIQGIYLWNAGTLRYELPVGVLKPGFGYWFLSDGSGTVALEGVVR
ncbi:MAG: hypothetical protein HN380_06085 [Victivallales bacterium]|nr:hypothetical protein [Victivallales bacterium]